MIFFHPKSCKGAKYGTTSIVDLLSCAVVSLPSLSDNDSVALSTETVTGATGTELSTVAERDGTSDCSDSGNHRLFKKVGSIKDYFAMLDTTYAIVPIYFEI